MEEIRNVHVFQTVQPPIDKSMANILLKIIHIEETLPFLIQIEEQSVHIKARVAFYGFLGNLNGVGAVNDLADQVYQNYLEIIKVDFFVLELVSVKIPVAVCVGVTGSCRHSFIFYIFYFSRILFLTDKIIQAF